MPIAQYTHTLFMNAITVFTIYSQGVCEYQYRLHNTLYSIYNIPVLFTQYSQTVFMKASTLMHNITKRCLWMLELFSHNTHKLFMNTCTVYTIYPQGVYEYLYCIHNTPIRCLWIPVLYTQYNHKVFMNTCTLYSEHNNILYCISRKC